MKKIVGLTLLGLFGNAHALPITVDGNLADWGVGPSSWTPAAGIHYTVEDQTGGSGARLFPGYGGQAYDAEALYATISGGKLYIALATGHDPRTVNNPGANSFGAGDFAIDFGKNGSYEMGINIKNAIAYNSATKTYTYESFGDQSGASTVGGVFSALTGVYKNPTWNYGLWNAAGNYDPSHPDPAHPTSLKSGTKVGMANLAYTTVGASGFGVHKNDLHYFYELSLDVSLLTDSGWDGQSAFNIHWTELCANDSIIADPPPGSVPEPGSMALLGLGFAGLLGVRRRFSWSRP